MQARCPHCSNVFATERSGQQFCPSCGQQVNVPDPVGAAPGSPPPDAPPGAPPEPPGQQPTPWERRKELGAFKGFFETWKSIITEPEQFWTRLMPQRGLSDALFFSWICNAVFVVRDQVMPGVGRKLIGVAIRTRS